MASADVTMVAPATLTVTANAARKVFELMKEEGDMQLKLRVYIEGGGCSGFQYGFTFDEELQEGDTVVRKQVTLDEDEEDDGGSGGSTAVEFVVDPLSYQYLIGAEIDYQDDLNGERFIIRNPNAQTTCGCGSSFSV